MLEALFGLIFKYKCEANRHSHLLDADCYAALGLRQRRGRRRPGGALRPGLWRRFAHRSGGEITPRLYEMVHLAMADVPRQHRWWLEAMSNRAARIPGRGFHLAHPAYARCGEGFISLIKKEKSVDLLDELRVGTHTTSNTQMRRGVGHIICFIRESSKVAMVLRFASN